ncbi:MAG: hypothetical protein IKN78_07415 [Bacteroidales bacterium]|nr:hypothetical protein [Bacteroidales bacterium]
MKRFLLLFVCCFLSAAFLNAQDVIYLNNGNVVKGKVVKNTDEVSVVLGSGETLTYRKAEVREVQIGSAEVTTPDVPEGAKYVDYSDLDKGWWCAVEAHAGGLWYDGHGTGTFALTFTNGYRFSEFMKIGVGIGARYNLNSDHDYLLYRKAHKIQAPMSVPLFVNARGNIISQKPRMCVPFWNADIGYAVFDGFFFDAGIGFRVGAKRNNFVMSANFTGQMIHYEPGDTCFGSGILFKIGYEF